MIAVVVVVALATAPAVPDFSALDIPEEPSPLAVVTVEDEHRAQVDDIYRARLEADAVDRAVRERRALEREPAYRTRVDAARQRLAERIAAEQAARRAEAARVAAEAARKAAEAAKAEAAARAAASWSLPVTDGYRLTGRFGNSGARWANRHTGLDFAAPHGTKIRSVHAGVVIETSWHPAFGNLTKIRNTSGEVVWYAHQSGFAVSEGESVVAGQYIGRLGSTGNSTGPHVHVEIHVGGAAVDPDAYLTSKGVQP